MEDTVDVKVLSLAGARRVLAAAHTSAEPNDLHMYIVICDPSGLPILSAWMDGAPLALDIAANKAFTVASFGGMPTDRWWTPSKTRPPWSMASRTRRASRSSAADCRCARRACGRSDRRVGQPARSGP
jgi:uncharacterized protein GlcG (DUF336 family)